VLHAAAAMGRLEVCKFLAEELGLDVNSTSTEGGCAVVFNTAYWWLMHASHVGEMPMLLAAVDGNVPVLQYLLSRGGDLAAPTSRGSTPFHNAVEHGALPQSQEFHGRLRLEDVCCVQTLLPSGCF
jgi:ankyrin repeat protein